VAGREPWTGGRAGFGIADLDALLGGGLTAGTTTLCAGSPGAGRTLLGLHFLAAGARAGESGLFLGFMESAAQLRAKARAFGLDLDGTEAAGRIELLVLPAYDLEADRAAWLLREAVERRSVRRLVVDSAIELQRGLLAPERAPEFFAALAAYLRGRDVTTYLTIDIPIFVGPELSFADTPLWVVAENLLLLRQVEYRGQLRRLVSVLKMRFSDYDRTVREFTVTEGQGIRVVGPAPPAEGLLTGLARPWPPWPPWPPAARGEAAGETGLTGPAGPAGPRGSSAPTAPSAPPPAPWGPNEE
jgi:circadian clock protein KaiC